AGHGARGSSANRAPYAGGSARALPFKAGSATGPVAVALRSLAHLERSLFMSPHRPPSDTEPDESTEAAVPDGYSTLTEVEVAPVSGGPGSADTPAATSPYGRPKRIDPRPN